MAKQFWQDLSIMYGTYDLACRARSATAPEVTVVAHDTTVLCNTNGYVDQTPALKSARWEAEVFQDFAADQVDQKLGLSSPEFGSYAPLSVLPAGITTGSLAYFFQANNLEYTPLSAAVGDMAMARVAGSTRRGPVVRGQLLIPKTDYTSTDAGTAAQLGAVSASQKLYAALHVFSVSGTSPTLNVLVRSDDDSGMGSATTQITFSEETDATTGWQWSSADGAIADDWFDVSYTIGGSDTPTFNFAVVVGIA